MYVLYIIDYLLVELLSNFGHRRPSLFSHLVSSCAGKVVNQKHLDDVINSINRWYMDRGLFGLVSALPYMVLQFVDDDVLFINL